MGALKSGAFPVELNGKEYGLLFSLNALDEVQEKFGGYDKLSEVFNKDNPNLFKDTRWLLTLLIINTRDKAQALELRRRMLKIFNPELSATLVYEYGGFKRVIDCRAYGEPKILKKEVLYEFDLQIECLNPFWREEEETKEDIASWVAAWHFPCVIEKDSTKSMIYGYRAESVIVDCYNEGDVSTGMRIRFTALGTVSNPILLNVDTEEFIQINATMKTGDVIEINTKYGSKGAKLIRDGVETDYFRYIDVDSTFMQLAIGDNMLRYDAASGVNSLEVSIFYSKEFLGV